MSQQGRSPFEVPGAQGAAQFMQGMYRKPTVLGQIAGVLFLLIVGVPLLLLLLMVAAVSVSVFLVLGLWGALTGRMRVVKSAHPHPKPGQDDAGRKNVRVRE